MNKKRSHVIIGLAIIAFSLFIAFRGVSISDLTNALLSVKYVYLFPALSLVIISYLLRAVRWHYFIRPVKEVKTSRLYSPMMVGFMANMLPARAGEFIRAYLLSKKEGISFSASFATIFIERLFDLSLVLMLLVFVLVFMPEAFVSADAEGGAHLLDKVKLFGLLSVSLCLFIFLFSYLLQFRNELAMRIVGIAVKPLPRRWREKIFDLVASFTEGLRIIQDRKGFIASAILSVLIWGTFVFTNYPLYFAFDIQSSLPIVSSLIVLCLTVAIFIAVVPTPGFLGSYHLGCVTALHGIFGIQKATALSYGVVSWLVVMGSTVVIGAVFALKENISFNEISAAEESAE